MGFLRYFCSHTPSDYYCHVQVVSQGQNWNWHRPPAGISVHALPLEGRLQGTRGCGHFWLSLAGPG